MVAVTVFVIIGMAVVQIIADKYGACCVCGSKERPEGHHVIEYQYGGAATIDNIVTLCQKCHKQVHRGNIDIMKF